MKARRTLLIFHQGTILGKCRDITPIMENQMEKRMENEMETEGITIQDPEH